MSHQFPKLHNAMWPGLVGKGGPGRRARHRARHHARSHRRGRGRWRALRRRRSVSLRSAHEHRRHRGRSEVAGGQASVAPSGRGLARRAGVAADRRRIGDGQRGGSQEVPHAGAQGVRDRQEAERDSARGSTASIRIDSASGVSDWVAGSGRQSEEDRRDVPAGVRHRRRLRRAARRRRRDLLGRHAQLEEERRADGDGRPAEDARLPGRHGAHAAVHDGLQRAGGSHPARRRTTGRTAPCSIARSSR